MNGVVFMCRCDAICDPHSKPRIDCVLTTLMPRSHQWRKPGHARKRRHTPLPSRNVTKADRWPNGLAHEHKAFVRAYE